ncbi:hypothetical protein LCGC14_1367820 [marine sediment metagenome]|uniref:Uncharacterized protein n=1 Tax=marine sediment metagenome TaxID=412755 RepID=A0A0F9KS71_9ZZZZ
MVNEVKMELMGKTDEELKVMALQRSEGDPRKPGSIALNQAERNRRDTLCEAFGIDIAGLFRFLLLRAERDVEDQHEK